MRKDTAPELQQRVTVGEIANLAGVRPSAVSNWRSRYQDFPLPVEETTGGDLFSLEGVLQWLRSKDKNFKLPSDSSSRTLWNLLEGLRAATSIEDSVLLLMQLLFVRSLKVAGKARPPTRSRDIHEQLLTEPRHARRTWEQWVSVTMRDQPSLSRALSLSPRVGDHELARAAQAMARLRSEVADWGQIASSLLQRYQETLGMRGSAYTPSSITALQTALLQPITGTVYDPAFGLGMVLAESWRRKASDEVLLVGQEVNEYNWRLGLLHLAIIGATFELETGDTLRDDRFRSLKADRIVIDPPLGLKLPVGELFADERWSYGIPRGSADWLWAQHLIYHLAETGVGVMTLGAGALFNKNDAAIRRALLESDVLDAVIDLPPGLFPGSSTSVALLIFASKRSNRKRRVLFLNAQQLGEPRRGRLHELDKSDVQQIVSAVNSWRRGSFEDEARFSASASLDDILRNDAELSPKRYLQYATEVTEIQGELIPERLARLTRTIRKELPRINSITHGTLRSIAAFTQEASADWPLVRLADLLSDEPQTGTRQDLEADGPETPYIQTGLVSGGTGRLTSRPDEVTRGKLKGRLVHKGDVLLASRGIDTRSKIGCASVAFDGVAAYSESLMRLTPDPKLVDPDYLRLFLTSRQGRTALVSVTTGSVIANLRGEALKQIQVRLPDLSTQHEIVSSMRKIEEGVCGLSTLANTSREVLDTLREGVVSGLYTPHRGKAPTTELRKSK